MWFRTLTVGHHVELLESGEYRGRVGAGVLIGPIELLARLDPAGGSRRERVDSGSKVEVRDSTPPEYLPWPEWCTEGELRTILEIIERSTVAMEAGEPQPGAARRSRPEPSTVLNLRQ